MSASMRERVARVVERYMFGRHELPLVNPFLIERLDECVNEILRALSPPSEAMVEAALAEIFAGPLHATDKDTMRAALIAAFAAANRRERA